MDSTVIGTLFSDPKELAKLSKKTWIIIHDSNNNNYNTPIRYVCTTLQDKLVDYSQGYILIDGYVDSTTQTALAAGDDIGLQNGSNSVIKQALIRIQDADVENNKEPWLTTTWHNLLEYSPDFASSNAVIYGFARDESLTGANNEGYDLRKEVMNGVFAVAAGNLPARRLIRLTLPLSYVSQFFRRLTFPIINNKVEIELTLNRVRSILRVVNEASRFVVTNTTLHLPRVELPTEFNTQLMDSIQRRSMSKTVYWDHNNVYIHTADLAADTNFDLEVTTSAVGVRRILFIVVPDWDDQENVQTGSNVKVTNFNVQIDSEDYFPRNVSRDEEAYQLLKENFNAAGSDFNTGSLLPYNDWTTQYRLYVVDLSRQKIFESDPNVPQNIRLRGTPDADGRLVVVLSQYKKTIIDMASPENTRTI